MNDGELRNLEREIGRLAGIMDGVCREIRVLRDDGNRREQTYLTAIAEHDQRDDTRFAGVDRELAHINSTIAIHDQRNSDYAISGERRHSWKITLVGALAVIAAALISAVAAAHIVVNLH